ncbi:hypothetical protein VTK56DRAFT_2293 [Thermocarpiscus australiensis]
MDIDGLMAELGRFDSQLLNLKRDLTDAKDTSFRLAQEKVDLIDKLEHLKAYVDELEDRLSRPSGEERELAREKKDLLKKLENQRAYVDELEGRLRKLSGEVAERDARHEKLESSYRGLQAEVQTTAEKSRLEALAREREAENQRIAAENLRLNGIVQEREAELGAVKGENVRLQSLVREKEAQISCMTALPITPMTPLAPLLPVPIPEEQAISGPLQHDPADSPLASPGPYIKAEGPDQTSPAVVGMPGQSEQLEQRQDPLQQVNDLGIGLTNMLGTVFQIKGCDRYNRALVGFIAKLGAVADMSDITVTPATGFWELREPWAMDRIRSAEPRPTLEEKFAQICLLFPFPQHQGREEVDNDTARFQALAELITSLIKADHSSSPRAGVSFLATMATLCPAGPAEGFSTRTTMLAVMLCELCRLLERTFPEAPKQSWDIGTILGPEVQEAAEKLPIGRLAAALREPDRSGACTRSLKEQLAATCGDEFCVFGQDEGERGIGLLHCGESCSFLMIDFAERSFRLVDCRLTSMMPNASEPRKLDLIVSRAEEELFRVTAAPREVAAFWLKYAMGDV